MDFNPQQPSAPPQPRDRSALYSILAAAVGLAAVLLIYAEESALSSDVSSYFSTLSSGAPVAVRPVRVTIDFGNGTKRAFEGPTEAGMTALSALRASAIAGEFTIATDERGRLTAVAGLAIGRKRWQVYRNGEAVQDLPGHVTVKPGDRIMFRYE